METVSGPELAALAARLGASGVRLCDVELIEQIAALECLKNAAASLQARAAVELRRLRESEAAAAGRNVRRVGPAVAAEVALARHESPHKGAQLLGLAWVLVREMPCTLAAFTSGQISEWRASLVARETACLSRQDRELVDARLGERLATLSDRQVIAEARRVAYRLDPHSVVARVANAEADRRVSIRPAPDCMARVSALLPVAQGVAVYAALTGSAATARAAGDARGKGQVMADTLVERVTGQAAAAQVPVEVQVVITDQALLGDSDEPARLTGLGPIPAGIARRLARVAADGDQLWVRRLYSRPDDGTLVATESTRRLFPAGLKALIRTRDEVCRTPWCGAPIRHIDHITPFHAGGATVADNGQGLCERCNQVKEAPGWHAAPATDGSVLLRPPTGHQHVSRPPDLPSELSERNRFEGEPPELIRFEGGSTDLSSESADRSSEAEQSTAPRRKAAMIQSTPIEPSKGEVVLAASIGDAQLGEGQMRLSRRLLGVVIDLRHAA